MAKKKKKPGQKKKSSLPPQRVVLGGRILAVPHIGDHISHAQPGTVIYINDKHNWFRVRFDLGFTQCYPMRCKA